MKVWMSGTVIMHLVWLLARKQITRRLFSHFLNALRPRQSYFGEDSAETSSTLFEVAEAYTQLGEWKSALEYSITSLRIRKTLIGTDNIEYAESLIQLGDIKVALLAAPRGFE